jgi:hypothetical protein
MPSISRAFSPPDKVATGASAAAPENPMAPARANPGFRRLRHQRTQVVVRARLRIELIELMLGEIGGIQLVGAGDPAGHGRQAPGQEFRERRFAVAVGPDQRDAVVIIDAQVEPAQHRNVAVADRHVVESDDWRRQRFCRRGYLDRAHGIVDDGRNRLQSCQQLEPRLRLACLGGLGAEARHESFDPLALGLLLLGALEIERLLLAPLASEAGIVAAVKRELAALEVQDVADGAVEQVAVVADHHDGVRIAREIILQPQRPFQVEIVGRLVQQQKIGLGEEERGERDPHAPAAGERRARPLLLFGREAEAGEDRGRARRRRVGIDVGEAGVNLGDVVGVVRLLRRL